MNLGKDCAGYRAGRQLCQNCEESRVDLEVRRCRVCGCTDDDCRGCIQRTGSPCSWVEADLCSACQTGFNTQIKVKRGNTNVASVRVGGKYHRASSTNSEEVACRVCARKAAAFVRATAWRVERYRTLSLEAGRAALYLEFSEGEKP